MTQKHYDVACVPCADYTQDACRAALCQALEALDVLAWLRPGMTVGIKANLVAAHAPDDAVTTHPRLLAALCQLLRERGVLLVPGSRFELPCGARLGYCASEETLRRGLALLSEALREFD